MTKSTAATHIHRIGRLASVLGVVLVTKLVDTGKSGLKGRMYRVTVAYFGEDGSLTEQLDTPSERELDAFGDALEMIARARQGKLPD